jgi:hypothetical protein
MSKISVTLQLEVSDQLCKDLLTTAFEGGSAYWLACDRVEREPDLAVIRIVGCCDREDDTTKWPDATLETMREGIRLLLSGEVQVNATTRNNLFTCVVSPDNGDFDADDADCVLQAGLLNDIVYG